MRLADRLLDASIDVDARDPAVRNSADGPPADIDEDVFGVLAADGHEPCRREGLLACLLPGPGRGVRDVFARDRLEARLPLGPHLWKCRATFANVGVGLLDLVGVNGGALPHEAEAPTPSVLTWLVGNKLPRLLRGRASTPETHDSTSKKS